MLIATDLFAVLARSRARAEGVEGLRMVVVPHPVGGLPPEEVRQKADAIFADLVRALTGQP